MTVHAPTHAMLAPEMGAGLPQLVAQATGEMHSRLERWPVDPHRAAQRLTEVETLLNGHAVDEDLIREAAAAAAQTIDPSEDLHAGAAYRRALVATLFERSLRAASLARG